MTNQLTTVTRVIKREQIEALQSADMHEMHNKTLETMDVGIKLTEQVFIAQTEAAKLYTAGTVLTSLSCVGVGVGLLIWGYRIGSAICSTIKK